MATKSGSVSMKHRVHSMDKMMYFYEGSAQAKEGVLTLPKSHPEWIKRAWILGYDVDPKTGKHLELADLVESE